MQAEGGRGGERRERERVFCELVVKAYNKENKETNFHVQFQHEQYTILS